ncbi:MAG: hypothetical protein H7175_01065 [Burkholderiales bacterium]|nr:hypothetical protein [Anaerolineae bacterium]
MRLKIFSVGARHAVPLLCLLLLFVGFASAQESVSDARLWQVFLQRNTDGEGSDLLVFIDMLTGNEVGLAVRGSRYTPFGRYVMFLDAVDNRVKLAAPDGRVQEHPFIQPQSGSRRIDWWVSPNAQHVAWTQTFGENATQLTTETWVSTGTGANLRSVLADGPRDGIRALPVAFSDDGATLYLDYQPDSISDLLPLRQFAGLFAVDLTAGTTANLPDEPGCYCGAGIGGGRLLRLTLTSDLTGYDLQVYNLADNTKTTIRALSLAGYSQAGEILISPDGTRAAYALAEVEDFGGDEETVRSAVVLVDLLAMTQTALDRPLSTFVQPVAWTEDNTAVVFAASASQAGGDGTWKINFVDGRVDRIARASYLGAIRIPS